MRTLFFVCGRGMNFVFSAVISALDEDEARGICFGIGGPELHVRKIKQIKNVCEFDKSEILELETFSC